MGGTISNVVVQSGTTSSTNNEISYGHAFTVTITGTGLSGVTAATVAGATATVSNNTATQVVLVVTVHGADHDRGLADIVLTQGGATATGGEARVNITASVAATTGNDTTGLGTDSRPFASLQRAVNGLSALDVAVILPGDYDTPFGVTIPTGVIVEAPIDGMTRARLIGGGTGQGVTTLGPVHVSGLAVTNFSTAFQPTGGGVHSLNDVILDAQDGKALLFNGTFTGLMTVRSSYVSSGTCATCVGIEHNGSPGSLNVISSTVDGGFYGIVTMNSSGTFQVQGEGSNTTRITGAVRHGILVDGTGGSATVTGTVVRDCGEGGIVTGLGAGTRTLTMVDVDAVSNVGGGMRLLQGTANITGGLVTGNTDYGIGVFGTTVATVTGTQVGDNGSQADTAGVRVETTTGSATLNDMVILGNGLAGGLASGVLHLSGALTINGGTISNNNVGIISSSTGPLVLTVGTGGDGMQITNNVYEGIVLQGGGNGNVTIDNAMITGNQKEGLVVAPLAATTTTKIVNVTSTVFSYNGFFGNSAGSRGFGFPGIDIRGTERITVRFTGCTITYNGKDGLRLSNPRGELQMGEAGSTDRGGGNAFERNNQLQAADCSPDPDYGDYHDARPVVSGVTPYRVPFSGNMFDFSLPANFPVPLTGDQQGPLQAYPVSFNQDCLAGEPSGEGPGRYRIILDTAASQARFQ